MTVVRDRVRTSRRTTLPFDYASMRRRRQGVVLPLVLGGILTVLVLVPIVLMFVGAVRTGTFVDPRAQFSLRSLTIVYTTWPFSEPSRITVGASLLVSFIACLAGIALAWLLARTDMPAKGVDGELGHRAALSLAVRRRTGMADPGVSQCRPPQRPRPRPVRSHGPDPQCHDADGRDPGHGALQRAVCVHDRLGRAEGDGPIDGGGLLSQRGGHVRDGGEGDLPGRPDPRSSRPSSSSSS